MIRQIKRQRLKNAGKTNKIGKVWRKLQIEKYGFKEWLHGMYIPCNGKKQ